MTGRVVSLPVAGGSLREPFGQFDQDAPIGRIIDLLERDDKPQTFDDVQIDLVVPEQLPQFIAGMIGIVDAHRKAPDASNKRRPATMI
jgi:hypothetical protein